jgi:mono/diheme cytochrome c family protein
MYHGLCASCHAVDHVLVGPPLTEIAELYAGNPSGIVQWTRSPGKKRKDFPTMPAFRLPEAKLAATAEYILQLGSGKATPESQPAAGPAGEQADQPSGENAAGNEAMRPPRDEVAADTVQKGGL